DLMLHDAAGGTKLVDLEIGLRERLLHERELQGDTLDRGPHEVSAPVRAGESDVCAAGDAAPAGRALAEQVREHEEATGSCGHRHRLVEQLGGGEAGLTGGELAPHPVE